jgi:hypothetical protein
MLIPSQHLVVFANTKAEIVPPGKLRGRCLSVSVTRPCYSYIRYLVQCANSALDQLRVKLSHVAI